MNEHSYSMGDDKTASPDQRYRGCCPQAASQASSDRLDGCPIGPARLRRGYTTAATESSWARGYSSCAPMKRTERGVSTGQRDIGQSALSPSLLAPKSLQFGGLQD